MNVTLYKRDSEKKIQEWTIELDRPNGRYRTITGEQNGKMVTSKWTDAIPKNVGRSNETSKSQQAEKEALAKIKQKKDKGYVEDINEVDNVTFREPLLAKSFDDYGAGLVYPVLSQPKLDGIRCTISVKGLISRNNKPIVSCPHLLEQFNTFLANNPYFPKNIELDGELYNHRYKEDFNRICELIRPTKCTPEQLAESSRLVQFWCYDWFFPGEQDKQYTNTYRDDLRIKLLTNKGKRVYRSIVPVKSKKCKNRKELDEMYEAYLEEKFEGQMIRNPNALYNFGRTTDLLKRKEFQDREWTIAGVYEGTGNRAGTAGYFTFLNDDGTPFLASNGHPVRSNIKGPFRWLTKLWEERETLIGKQATVRFFKMTPDGVPRFPYVTSIRDYE